MPQSPRDGYIELPLGSRKVDGSGENTKDSTSGIVVCDKHDKSSENDADSETPQFSSDDTETVVPQPACSGSDTEQYVEQQWSSKYTYSDTDIDQKTASLKVQVSSYERLGSVRRRTAVTWEEDFGHAEAARSSRRTDEQWSHLEMAERSPSTSRYRTADRGVAYEMVRNEDSKGPQTNVEDSKGKDGEATQKSTA